jgi:hypothetical protein
MKRPLGRPIHKWVDSINMDLVETEWGSVDWIGLARDRDMWRAVLECGNEPSGSIKCWGNYRLAAQLVVSRVEFVSLVASGTMNI